ncbi:MAG: hypothetical protein U0269_19635 [Polyangiales bacterium]
MKKQPTNERAIEASAKRKGGGAGSRRHLKGAAVEVFIYRVRYGQPGRGGKRRYVANVLPTVAVAIARRAGPGVYRLEYRDQRRWVVSVQMLVVESDGRWWFAGRAKRSAGPRKFPPPWDGWTRRK